MPAGFRSETLSLADFFRLGRFRVPDYQRPYSWTTREAEQLLDDIAVARDDSVDSDAEETGYFLGSVLLMSARARSLPGNSQSGTPEASPVVYDIVDGQQRIVTLTMLLALLRDLLGNEASAFKSALNDLIWDTSTSGSREPRVSLRERERRFLRDFAQEPGGTEIMPPEDDLSLGEGRMLAVREHLAEALVGLSREELETLARYLMDFCHFSVITTRSVDRAHRMFTVLNNRGRPLDRNDILKAQLLGGIAADRQQQFTEVWDGLEQRLGNEFDSLFSHIRSIELRARTGIISGISDLVEQAGGVEPFFQRTLQPYARIYETLQVRPVAKPADRSPVSRYLTYLGWLNSTDWMPPAMLFWHQCNGDPARLETFLCRLDRLAYALRMLGIGGDKRVTRFNALTAALREGRDLSLADSPLELSRDELRNINYNLRNLHTRSQLTCKLVLLRINDRMAGVPQDLDPASFTVEHVLPQKPSRSSDWRQWYQSADERERCTQSLGNFVLVTRSENDRARNLELARKLEVYFSGGPDAALHITRDLLGVTEWRPAQVLAREENLIEAIRALWQLELPRTSNGNDGATAPEPQPARRKRRRTGT